MFGEKSVDCDFDGGERRKTHFKTEDFGRGNVLPDVVDRLLSFLEAASTYIDLGGAVPH